MKRILGIDLGTTNSVMAIMENDKPMVVPNKRGLRVTPSVVAYNKEWEVMIGQIAKNQSIINAERTINSIKRKMGSNTKIQIASRIFTPQEISAEILSKLKEDAEDYLGEKITKTIITVPAYFNDNQRQATKEAGIIAGLEVVRIINEPTAAALAYGFGKNENQTILIYDLGGGTFDVSILEIGDGVFEVKATNGNNKLGGDDFDRLLLELVLKKYRQNSGIDLSLDAMAIQKLKEEIEKIKINLSETETSELNIPFISANENGPQHINFEIRRSDFEELIQEYIEETLSATEKAIQDANLTKNNIDKVILVGGSTKIPFVQQEVSKLMGKEITKGINPDECVAIGAAIQASILSGNKKGMVLVDITPLSLGIEIEGGVFIPIIDRNSPIPITENKLFTTISDFQKNVEINIYQGERIRCIDNIPLGRFQLESIRPAKKGDPRIEVTFSINVDGILEVKAKDLDTSNYHKIKITNPNTLNEKEINKIIENAQINKDKDKQYIEKEKIKEKFETEYQKLKTLYQQNIDKIDSTLVKETRALIKNVEKKSKNLNTNQYNELIDSIEFINGELKAVCTE